MARLPFSLLRIRLLAPGVRWIHSIHWESASKHVKTTGGNPLNQLSVATPNPKMLWLKRCVRATQMDPLPGPCALVGRFSGSYCKMSMARCPAGSLNMLVGVPPMLHLTRSSEPEHIGHFIKGPHPSFSEVGFHLRASSFVTTKEENDSPRPRSPSNRNLSTACGPVASKKGLYFSRSLEDRRLGWRSALVGTVPAMCPGWGPSGKLCRNFIGSHARWNGNLDEDPHHALLEKPEPKAEAKVAAFMLVTESTFVVAGEGLVPG